VPLWNAGQEHAGGTSMSAPHAAGLAARLLSGLAHEGRRIRAADVRAALIGTARPDRSPVISQGAGVPDLPAAWRWLVSGRRAPDVTARAVGGTDAAVLASVAPDASAPAGQAFELVRPRN